MFTLQRRCIMPKSPRIPNEELLAAGVELMKQNGQELTKVPGFAHSMMYSTPDKKTVRVRTCNDHILIVLGDQASGNARLNIEGTDCLLVVMPEFERTPGKVKAYLVPTDVACEAARRTHLEWLGSDPNTKGENKTWNLWFSPDGPAKANNFETHWAKYLLKGDAYTTRVGQAANVGETSDGSVKTEVDKARQRISKAAGVPPTAVRISIDFGL
jgi:hypothetical protein